MFVSEKLEFALKFQFKSHHSVNKKLRRSRKDLADVHLYAHQSSSKLKVRVHPIHYLIAAGVGDNHIYDIADLAGFEWMEL